MATTKYYIIQGHISFISLSYDYVTQSIIITEVLNLEIVQSNANVLIKSLTTITTFSKQNTTGRRF